MIALKINHKAVPGAPFRVAVDPAPDAGAVRLSGPGLKHGNTCGNETHFDCDFSRAGKGVPTFQIEDPNGNQLKYSVEKVSSSISLRRRNLNTLSIIPIFLIKKIASE